MSRKRDLYPYWQEKEFDLDEIKIIKTMVDDRVTLYEDLKNNKVIKANFIKNHVPGWRSCFKTF